MSRRNASVWLVLSVAAFGAACGASESSTRVASAAPTEFIAGPHVPTGTAMQARLTQALDLSSSSSRPVIEAVLLNDLRTPRGDIMIRSGATIRGHIAWSPTTGRITLRDAHIDSAVGPLELHAALVGAGQPETAAASAAPFRAQTTDAPRTSEPLARQAGTTSLESLRGPIAADTDLTLQLTHPLLAPGASVLRP